MPDCGISPSELWRISNSINVCARGVSNAFGCMLTRPLLLNSYTRVRRGIFGATPTSRLMARLGKAKAGISSMGVLLILRLSTSTSMAPSEAITF